MSRKKVWVVTSGEYSDYAIEAVFSSKKMAENFIEKSKATFRGGEAGIDCFSLDPSPVRPRTQTCVFMSWGGDVVNWHHYVKATSSRASEVHVFPQTSSEFGLIRVTVVTSDLQRAVKVANEKRAQLIASNNEHYLDWINRKDKKEFYNA